MYRLYAWPVSPYSAKVRAYLRWKGAAFEDVVPSLFALRGKIRKAVGRVVMPTLELEDGTWLQDSSEMIDTLESRMRGPSITPLGERQRVANLLLELHADEWLVMAALHYRWSRPKNARFAMTEFARYGVPWLPTVLGRSLVRPVAKRMQSYLPLLGVDGPVVAGLEAFTRRLIERLDAHFATSKFVLGTRPALADFSLYGPLWAHLFRDVGTTSLFDRAPNVCRWIKDLQAPRTEDGEFFDDDAVPTTLEPILATILAEQGAYIQALCDAANRWCDEHPAALRLPRSLGTTRFSVGEAAGERRLLSEQLWKVQRLLDATSPAAKTWIEGMGALDWSPRFRAVRRNFRVVLAGAASS